MTHSGASDEFIMEMVSHQNQLYVYILSLVINKARAGDVLQQTNVTLLKKADDFEPGTNFTAWACRIAYYEVLADRKKARRDKLVFDEQVLQLLSDDASEQLELLNDRAIALDECLKQLTSSQRRLLMDRYRPGGSVQAMAEATGRTANAVSLTLHRLRATLADCVRGKLGKQAS